MNKQENISRKELAGLTNGKLSERTICGREQEFGLDRLRLKFARRPVLYKKQPAIAALVAIGAIEAPT